MTIKVFGILIERNLRAVFIYLIPVVIILGGLGLSLLLSKNNENRKASACPSIVPTRKASKSN